MRSLVLVLAAGCFSCSSMPAPSATCTDGMLNGAETDVDCGGTSCAPCNEARQCARGEDCESSVCTTGHCAAATCVDGKRNGIESDVDCGGDVCALCDVSKHCAQPNDCASGVCTVGLCAAASCSDGVHNGDELDVDCGGACGVCQVGQRCAGSATCASHVCTDGTCRAASCADGFRNQGEADVDCGGACGPCAELRGCSSAADCRSGVCRGGTCASATCIDGTRNGDETAIDCGGACSGCIDGAGCGQPADCRSGVCTQLLCAQATCTDGVRNGSEGDVDCGVGCALCATGRACTAAAQCTSGICGGGQCVGSSCVDGRRGGDESDIDCGGSCADCQAGRQCTAAADCASGVCTAGRCVAPSCSDGTRNGAEVDVDCGGPCGGCPDLAACVRAADCRSAVCTTNQCVAARCDDGIKNAAEADVDCGGTCAPCGPGATCATAADCREQVCASSICQPASCTDGVRNGLERLVDCAGGACSPCSVGAACLINTDCMSGRCIAGTCVANLGTVSSGGNFSCMRFLDGTVRCWGNGNLGQLGLGRSREVGSVSNPMASGAVVDLGTGRTALSVVAGVSGACAILDDGSVKCWGDNGSGQLGQGDTAARSGPGQMGDSLPAIALGAGRTARQVVTYERHACAILDDATLKCWGANNAGQLGLGDTNARGDQPNEMGASLPVVNLGAGRTAVSVHLGADSTCVLLDDATVKCWGLGSSGVLGQGSTTNIGTAASQMGNALLPINLGAGRTVRQLVTGHLHACALLDDNTVKCWGYNLDGRLGVGDLVMRGTVAGTMGDALAPINLGTGRTATFLSAMANGACARLDDASVRCWGWNNNGQLGQGDTQLRGATPASVGDSIRPILLPAGRSIRQFDCGWFSSCMILDDDTLQCWGAGGFGQLGINDSDSRGDHPNELGDALRRVRFFQ